MTDKTRSLFLIGATGRLGGRLLAEALGRGWAVTALVRDPARLAVRHPALRVVRGDVRDRPTLEALLPGHDAVVSALGTRRGQEPYETLSSGMAALAAAMEAVGPRRLVAVAAAGILQADAQTLRRDMPGYPAAFRSGSAEHLKAWQTLQASSLDWTIVCPPELVEGDRDQPLVVQPDYLPAGPKRVSMEALAKLMITLLQEEAHHGVRLGMSNAPER
ncbi:MAG: NAD(P)-dependent oxidoreductase [Candidatus Sericytochromatia bacterium]